MRILLWTIAVAALLAGCKNRSVDTSETGNVADTDTDADTDSDTDADTDTDTDTDTDSDTDSDTDADTDADVDVPSSFVASTSGGGSADGSGQHLKLAIGGQSYGSASGGGYVLTLGPIVPVP